MVQDIVAEASNGHSNGHAAATNGHANGNGHASGNGKAAPAYGFSTRAIHVGSEPDEGTQAVIPAISLSTTYKQDGVGGIKVRAGKAAVAVAVGEESAAAGRRVWPERSTLPRADVEPAPCERWERCLDEC